jgi:enoyl-CoA hydratase/carnithine racemase
MGEFVTLEVSDDGVGEITLSRPPVNALSGPVARELTGIVDEVRDDDRVRAVVVWGGATVFAAGADIKEMGELNSVQMQRHIAAFQDALTRLEQLPLISIAAITGYALGGGCELALACDLRVCAADAQLGQPEILLGVIPGAGGTQRLPRLIGAGRAKELIYSGRFVAADEALRIGLVTEVVPREEVHARATEIARGYASGPTVALAAAKFAVQNGLEADLTSGLHIERQAFAALFATEDQRIGMKSFVDRGPGKAKFVGR